jgi:hypothetical protein
MRLSGRPGYTRHCHGDTGCRFTFEQEDDWKYFQLDGKPFETEAEHDAHLERWRKENDGIAVAKI